MLPQHGPADAELRHRLTLRQTRPSRRDEGLVRWRLPLRTRDRTLPDQAESLHPMADRSTDASVSEQRVDELLAEPRSGCCNVGAADFRGKKLDALLLLRGRFPLVSTDDLARLGCHHLTSDACDLAERPRIDPRPAHFCGLDAVAGVELRDLHVGQVARRDPEFSSEC